MTTDPHGRPVLIVEDDPGMGVTLQRLVKSMGFSSVLVTTGEDALLTALSVRPLAILMDVLLPGIDGLSVTRHLREKGFSLPIVMISVAKTGADEVAGLVAGADDYIPKPFDVEVFKARFQLALRHARGQTTSNCLVIGQLAFVSSRIERNTTAMRSGSARLSFGSCESSHQAPAARFHCQTWPHMCGDMTKCW